MGGRRSWVTPDVARLKANDAEGADGAKAMTRKAIVVIDGDPDSIPEDVEVIDGMKELLADYEARYPDDGKTIEQLEAEWAEAAKRDATR